MPKLSMVLNKVGKTINLAKSTAYQIPRKPPLNSLIFEKLPEPQCGDKVTCGIKGPPISKPVRLCTKEDMQSFYCPPVPCDCKVKPPPLTFTQKIGCLIKQSIKAAIVGGIISFTYNQGLWSDAFHSSCFLGKIIEICPKEEPLDLDRNEFIDLSKITFDDLDEPCAPFIPHSDFMLYKTGQLWNHSVIFIFWLILEGPGALWASIRSFFEPTPKKKYNEECVVLN